MLNNKIKTFLPWDEIESQAQQQILNTASLDIIQDHIAIMPDCHYGKGATVGSVIPTYKAIIPAAVGVDIGCGMEAIKLNCKGRDIDEKMLKRWYGLISSAIPLGAGMQNQEMDSASDIGVKCLLAYSPAFFPIADNFSKNWRHQLGTLGSGNHFIELCLDQNDDVWLMVHSGSRGIGNRIGTYYIEKAKKQCIKLGLPDSDLSFIDYDSLEFGEYCRALEWAQFYAKQNRMVMITRCLTILRNCGFTFSICETNIVSCHHNYVEFLPNSTYLTRKGAISAKQGEMGIIPGSMGTKSYIVRGKGNLDSHHSASHGAGRTMSRGEAKRRFTLDDLIAQTEGVVCPKTKSVIDEIPAAYKDIDTVIARQSELIDVVYTLKQIMNIKG